MTIEIFAPELGTQRAADQQPLLGVTLDSKGSEAGSIDVMCGDSPDVNTIHSVLQPDHLRLAQNDDGQPQSLEIESTDGVRTVLWLGAAEFPATEEGIS